MLYVNCRWGTHFALVDEIFKLYGDQNMNKNIKTILSLIILIQSVFLPIAMPDNGEVVRFYAPHGATVIIVVTLPPPAI